MTFKDLKLKTNRETIEVKFNDNVINVLKYLPVNDKYDLIMATVDKSKESNGTYNPYKLDMYFHLNLLYLYTDIEFDIEDRADEAEIYDKAVSSGLINAILSAIPEDEFNELYNYVTEWADICANANKSIASIFSTFVNELPEQLNKAQDFLQNFDEEKQKKILEMFQTYGVGTGNIN